MSREKKDPLRELTEPERRELEQLGRSQVAPAVEVARAKALLAVAGGDGYQDAARSAAAPATPSPTSCRASTPRAPPP